jgi:anti-anti-sigma regulatory factor
MAGSSEPVDGGGRAAPAEELSEVVDVRAARITARGRLGVRGAELLAATVGQLRRSGAACVVLDLSQVAGAEPAALAVLARARREVAAAGARLVLCGGPARDVPVGPDPAGAVPEPAGPVPEPARPVAQPAAPGRGR